MVFQLRIPLVTIFSFNFAIITKNLFALTFVPFFFNSAFYWLLPGEKIFLPPALPMTLNLLNETAFLQLFSFIWCFPFLHNLTGAEF